MTPKKAEEYVRAASVEVGVVEGKEIKVAVEEEVVK